MTKVILSIVFLLLYPFLVNSNPVYQEECSSADNFKLLHSLSAGDFNGDGVMDIIGIDPSNGSTGYTYFFNNF